VSGSIFYGGSLLAALVAGAVALFAPCCLSVMLPAYFASAFANRRLLVAMTFVFGAGSATVILPLALGAVALRRALIAGHTAIYTTGGVLLLALAAYTLAGGDLRLPTPGRQATGRTGPAGVYGLGVFAGVTSACCAPVLTGVVALSGVAASFGFALALGAAYVAGMLAPLFALSLVWERHEPRARRLLRPRTVTWRLGPMRRTVTGTGLTAGLLLAAMGIGSLWMGLTGQPMPTPTGWQARLAAQLEHTGALATRALAWLPGWVIAVLLASGVAVLVRRALRQLGWLPTPPPDDQGSSPATPDPEEASR
jgi:cytochrome c biogenesis protein CcdA